MGISLARGIALVAALLASTTSFAAAPGNALDLATPEGGIAAFRKVQCSTVDEQPVVYYWVGETFSRVAGEPDKKLFRFQGMNVRQCVTITDPVRGVGFRQVSQEVHYYGDPTTGQILDEWKNPFLVVRPDGVEMVTGRGSSGANTVSVDRMREILVSLPAEAWPLGRVVAVTELSIRSGRDDELIDGTGEALKRMLKELRVEINWWP